MKIRPVLPVFILFLIACTPQEICESEGESEMVARFKMFGIMPVVDSFPTGVTLYGIRDGLPDSLLYDSTTLSRMVLPLDPHRDYSLFVLNINGSTDTLQVSHSTEAYLISYTCGFAAQFTLLDVDHTGTVISDVEIVGSQVDAEFEQNEEHIWIYL